MIPSKASLVATGVPVALDLLAGVIFVQHTVAWRRSRVRRPSRPHVWPALAIASAAAWELLLAICESTYFEKLYDAGLALAATAVYAPMAWSLSLGHWGGYLTVALACRLSWIISLRVAWSGVIVVAGIVSDTLGFMNSPYLGLTAAANVSLALAAGLFLGAATTGTQPQTALPTSRSRRGELEAPLLGERAASDAGRDEAEVRDVLFVVDWAMQALASRWLFMSVTPMFSAAQRRQLGPGDMPELRGNLATTECADALWAAWEAEVTRAQKQETSAGGAGRAPEWGKAVEPDACPAMPRGASLLRAMLGAFGGEYWLLGGLKLLGDSLNFAAPMLLHQLVRYMQEVPVEVPERAGGAGAGVPWWLGGALVELGKHGRHKPAWWERWGLTPLELGVAYAVLLGATSLLKAVLNTQYSFRMGAIQCRLRAALTCAVCRKSLLVNVANLSEFSSGGVQTLMSVDADRVVGLALSFHELWSLPLQIVAALFLLWTQVRGAFLAGLALVVLMIPANRWLSTRIGRAAQRMMMAKDRRVRLVTEMVANMKQIRMLGWEAPVASRVQHHRGRELRALSVHKYLDAVCVFFWAATSLAFSVSTFVLYAALGHKLTASAVFTSMVLFNTLIAPLNSFPWVINGVVEAMVSVNRLSHFLRAPECSRSWNLAKAPHAADCGDASRADAGDALPPSRMATLPEVLESVTPPRGGRASPPPYLSKHSAGSTGTVESARIDAEADASPPAPVASFSDASFAWAPGAADGSPPRLVLRDLRLSVPEGALVVVTGPTGSGKSSLLHAVVGELYMESGRRHARGKMALVPEEPWLVRGTIRDNITMHMPYEESKFRAVVRSCALEADLDGFLRGAHETVGDRGVTLSGGQRKRIALARALYSEADTFLIDDILAAVDAKVANWIFEKTILVLLRAGKTVLLCTHTTRPLASADLVVELEAGRVVKVTSSAAAVPWAHASHDSRLEGAVGVSPGGGASSVRLLGTTLPAQYGDWQSMVEAPFAGAPDDDDGSSGDEHLLSLLTPRDGWRPLRMEDVPELSLDAPPSPSPHASPVGSFADASTPLSATPPSRHALPGVPEERPAVPRHIPAPLVLPEAPETERDADEGKILSVSGRVRDSATGAEDRSRTSTMEDLRHAQRRQRRDGTAARRERGVAAEPGGSPRTPRGSVHAHRSDSSEGPGSGGAGGPLSTAANSGSNPDDSSEHSSDKDERGGAAGPQPPFPGSGTQGEERREAGHVRLRVYVFYLAAAGTLLSCCVLVSLALMQATRNAADLWLSFWVTNEAEHPVNYWITVLLAISACNLVFTGLRAGLFAVGGMRAARTLHLNLMRALLSAPPTFFDVTPQGRVLNRFSSDTATADDSLPFILNIFLANVFAFVGILAVLCFAQPLLLALLVPLGVAYLLTSRYYREAAREIRRLDAVAQSPLYGIFTDLIEGGPTLRAAGLQPAMMAQAVAAVCTAQRAALASVSAAQWLAVRLQLISGLVVMALALLAVLQHCEFIPQTNAEASESAGLLGLSLAYVLPITGLLNGLLTSGAEAEQEIVAVERILEYLQYCEASRGALDPPPRGGLSAPASGSRGGSMSAHVSRREMEQQEVGRIMACRELPLQGTMQEPAAEIMNAFSKPLLWIKRKGDDIVRGLRRSATEGASVAASGPDHGEEDYTTPGFLRRRLVEQHPGLARVFAGEGNAGYSWTQHDDSSVAFTNVTLSYRAGLAPALRGVTFRVASHERVAIVGRTGAGKSSIFGALLRLYPIQRGSIQIGGRDAAEMSLSDLHGMVAIVTQNPFVMEGTLRENLDPEGVHETGELAEALYAVRLWQPFHVSGGGSALAGSALSLGEGGAGGSASRLEGRRGAIVPQTPRRGALSMAPLSLESLQRIQPTPLTAAMKSSPEVEALLSTPVRSGVLSHGQQQLLAMARVLLRRPRVVLLDECTSGIDRATAAFLQVILERALSRCTILRIAHRLGSVMESDRVLVMRGGVVAEQGTPHELLARKNSLFSELIKADRTVNAGDLAY